MNSSQQSETQSLAELEHEIDIHDAIEVLKKVKQYDQSSEYIRFLFIMSIIGIIAIFEGFLAYLVEKYVGVSITKAFAGEVVNDPVLLVGLYVIQIALFSSLVLYTQTSKSLLGEWGPYFKKLAIIWALIYLSSFVINVILIQLGNNYEQYGPSIWAILLSLAFLITQRVLKEIIGSKDFRNGFYTLSLLLLLLAIMLLFIEKIYAMLLLGMTIGVSLLIISGILYLKTTGPSS